MVTTAHEDVVDSPTQLQRRLTIDYQRMALLGADIVSPPQMIRIGRRSVMAAEYVPRDDRPVEWIGERMCANVKAHSDAFSDLEIYYCEAVPSAATEQGRGADAAKPPAR
ncbi:MAG TPA: hypothetical protein VGJ87_23685, partial [Roseiflexaceae bacterium]